MKDLSSAAARLSVGQVATKRAIALGAIGATVAVVLRLAIPAGVGGYQAIFSYPAIVIVTLLFGVRAGSIAGMICFGLLWYYVLPPVHSFELASASAAITLAVYIVVGASLIWAIGSLRDALASHRRLNADLQRLVEQRTAERNRVWERSRELVAIVEHDGFISSANPSFCDLLGLQDAALQRRKFETTLVEGDRRAYHAARDNNEKIFEARLDAPAGIAWVSWSIVHDAGRLHLIGRDFTAEHDCSEMLRQSQKMEIIGQLAGGLAHDFGNLLPPISMTLHMLRNRHAEDARTQKLIEGAEGSVERADTLIKRLLEISRPSRIEPTTRPVGPLLDEIVPLLRQSIGRRQLRLSVEPNLPGIRVDASQLDMALLNLVLNARDATTEAGILDLQVTQNRSGQVDLSLVDDGCGMDAATLARATEPFFSTKASGEGTGLGLAMVHNFAIASGGSFAIESLAGEGTRATLSLPSV